MGQNHGGGVSRLSYRNARDVVFLGLRDTVICTECELISYNHSSRCLACGSLAVLSLSRVLGGSLRDQETARLVRREEIHSVVGEILRGMDSSVEQRSAAMPLAAFGEPRRPEWGYATVHQSGIPIPALEAGVLRSCDLTGATGAAVAISDGRRMVCRARAGSTAPDVGVEVPQEGLTALSVRTGRLWRCDDAEREPWANRNACRALGIRSIVIAPIVVPRRVLGVLEVFSPSPSAFDDYHSATVQLVASALAVAILRGYPPKHRGERGALPRPNDAQ
jgi:hypothetical protein